MSTVSIPDQCRSQALWCKKLGSPLYHHLLNLAADDYEDGGPVQALLARYQHEPRGSALPLRMMGAVHRLALTGEAREIARFYPSCGGTVQLEPAWDAFRDVVQQRNSELQDLITRPVQTNEVGRCGALLGGFFLIARLTGLPLRLLEIGASAGLNLRWDQYHYTWPGGAWGDPGSPVKLHDVFTSDCVPEPCDVNVIQRQGCDPNPVDATTEDGRLTLLQFIWADQTARIQLLDRAIQMAREVPCQVEQANAVDWLPRVLAQPSTGTATVLFHSVVWQYISHEERAQLTRMIEEACANATAAAPFAWLRMEPGKDGAEVRLRIAPGFEDQIIATASYHVPKVQWIGPSA
jgi:hypothetical protein